MTQNAAPVRARAVVNDQGAIIAYVLENGLAILADEKDWKTAPFWLTVVAKAIGLLVLVGLVKPEVASNAELQMLIQYVVGALLIVVPHLVYTFSHAMRVQRVRALTGLPKVA